MNRFLALLLLFAPAAFAQQATVGASRDSVRVGETWEMTLRLRHGVNARAAFPDTGRAFAGPDVEVLEKLGEGTAFGGAADPGTRLDSAVYRVAAFALDTLRVPPIGLGIVVGVDTALVPTLPFALPIVATAPDSAAGLRPARPPMRFPIPFWVWLAGAAALAFVAALAYALLRRRKRRPAPAAPAAPPITAAEHARARLLALEGTDLSPPPAAKPYYVELTEAVRQYLERVTAIPALELTSGELIRQAQAAARAGTVHADVPRLLVAIFPVADFAKFADGVPLPAEGAQALRDALALVDRMEMHRALRAAPPAHA